MERKQSAHGSYTKFFAMLGTSMVAMFFLMYLNAYPLLEHVWFRETRLFMTLIMGAAMMAIMLVFMREDGVADRRYQSQWDGRQPSGSADQAGTGLFRYAGISVCVYQIPNPAG
jgi:hypothetical protein